MPARVFEKNCGVMIMRWIRNLRNPGSNPIGTFRLLRNFGEQAIYTTFTLGLVGLFDLPLVDEDDAVQQLIFSTNH